MKTMMFTLCTLMLLLTNGYAAIPPVDMDYDGDVDGKELFGSTTTPWSPTGRVIRP